MNFTNNKKSITTNNQSGFSSDEFKGVVSVDQVDKLKLKFD